MKIEPFVWVKGSPSGFWEHLNINFYVIYLPSALLDLRLLQKQKFSFLEYTLPHLENPLYHTGIPFNNHSHCFGKCPNFACLILSLFWSQFTPQPARREQSISLFFSCLFHFFPLSFIIEYKQNENSMVILTLTLGSNKGLGVWEA